MAFSEYNRTDGLGLAEHVANKDVTAAELLEEAIARAERLNPALNAIVYKDYERARAVARGPLPAGPFAGVPFLFKDIFAMVQGTPTRQGARFFPAFPADHDSYLTVRFKKAGLIAFGKTNVPEFGLVPTTEGKLYGPAHNPWNLAHSTGGSSGGSAAAVAAGIVPLAHGNDGGGSIRIPASCCGLVGLKPSRGRISYGPDMADAVDGLAVDLVVSRSVRDTAAALDAAGGNEPGDPYSAPPAPASYLQASKQKPKRLRIGFAKKKLDGTLVHPDCIAAVEHAAKLCADLGHAVEEASPDVELAVLMPAFMALWTSNLAAIVDFVARLTGQTPSPDNMEGLTLGLYEAGKRVGASDYLLAKMTLNLAARGAAKFHQTYDLWLTATLGAPPVKLGSFDLEERDPGKGMAPFVDYVPFTAAQNITGQPAINLPLHWNAAGLPIGVQFVAPLGDELTLLQLATQLEHAAPWFARYATIKV
ncbi:MAG: amidase [Alphaproteobacteria bacterium]|nr:amidase [Alphaproteobacteria bacterium]MDE2629879.1 amidase [Alphaproteobacteria bacterium]